MKKQNVLLVDDDPLLLKIMLSSFRSEGLDVTTSTNGKEALELIKKNNYSVVLLDLILPFKNGFEVLSELKDMKNKTHVIVFTNLAQDNDRKEIASLGGKGYFVKSDTPLSTIVKVIKEYRQ